MRRIFRWLTAEPVVVFVVVVNAVALALMGSGEQETALAQVARWVDYGCVLFFVTEMAARLRVDGWPRYWASGWNRFDLGVVVASSPVLLLPWYDGDDLRNLAVLLVLRLGRLFRLLRVLRFIPNRERLYHGVKRALKASVGVFVSLVILDIVLSIGATHLFGRFAEEHFGNPLLSSYSLFRVFTVEGWTQLADDIVRNAPPAYGVLARIYFTVAVLVGGVLGLSLANAVFVDEMTADNTKGLERKVDALLDEVRALRAERRGTVPGDGLDAKA